MNEKHILVVAHLVTCAAFVIMYKRFIDDFDLPDADELYAHIESLVRLEVEKQIADPVEPNGNGGGDSAA